MNNWRISMTVITAPLVLSVLTYFVGMLYSRAAPDSREELREPLAAPEVCAPYRTLILHVWLSVRLDRSARPGCASLPPGTLCGGFLAVTT